MTIDTDNEELNEEEITGLELAASYSSELDSDTIESLALASTSAADYAEKLASAARKIAVDKAVDAVAEAAEKKFKAIAEEHGLDQPRRAEDPANWEWVNHCPQHVDCAARRCVSELTPDEIDQLDRAYKKMARAGASSESVPGGDEGAVWITDNALSDEASFCI